MRNNLYTLLCIVILASVLSACASGKKSLNRGEYYDAVLKSVNRLRSNGSNGKARQTLREAYPFAVDYELEKVKQASTTTDENRYDRMINGYNRIHVMYDEIKRCPAALGIISSPKRYDAELLAAKKNAAAIHYNAGMTDMATANNNRDKAKEAYFHFKKAWEYVPDYNGDVEQRMNEAKYLATLKIVIEQIPVMITRYSCSSEFFQNKISEHLHNFDRSEFVRFYSPQEVQSEKLCCPDQIIRFQFDDFSVGDTYTKERIQTVTDSITKEVKQNGETITIKEQVSANLSIFERTVVSKGVLDMRIIDAKTGSVLMNQKLPGEFVWMSDWGTYQGDSRALSAENKALIQRREAPVPDKQTLFIEFCKPIYSQIVDYVRNYYRDK